MTGLAAQQERFMALLLDEGVEAPRGWPPRLEAAMAIYRGNYRSALMEGLADLYERTRAIMGADSFDQAAMNHLIETPPAGWSIDQAGAGFAATCAAFLPDLPLAAEMAALEWAMHRAGRAGDAEPLTTAAFTALAPQTDESWVGLRLRFLPGTAVLPVGHDLAAVWRGDDAAVFDGSRAVIVFREEESPVFVDASAAEGRALAAMIDGATYLEILADLVDEIGEGQGVAEAGAMLARWLDLGIVAAILD